jgi:hypothetical protein
MSAHTRLLLQHMHVHEFVLRCRCCVNKHKHAPRRTSPGAIWGSQHASRYAHQITAQLDEQGNTHLPTYTTHQDTDHSSRTDAHPCNKSGCCWQA